MDVKRSELIVNGYMRNAAKLHKLWLNIDLGINAMILQYYLIKLLKFDCCHNSLEISEDETEIAGINDCSAYAAFTTLLPNDRQSIYFWTVELIDYVDCYRSIGILSHRGDWKNKHYANWFSDAENRFVAYSWNDNYKGDLPNLHFNGYRRAWTKNQQITLKLDYGRSVLSFFRDKQYIGTAMIDPCKSYFFALLLCADPVNKVKIVELDTNCYQYQRNHMISHTAN